ncbi:four helix bundle protein [Candidatus Gottesmanbacteria bacterium]|nr:four helix bundle protein [Candidatus Gottesmanbacteria bacterium]
MLPKHKYLLSYRYAELVHDGTVVFTTKYLGDFQNRRTREQMDQAARSGKQNIVEGVEDSPTSKKTEIKLLGIARGSIEELITDYEDYLRQHNLKIWPKTDQRILNFRSLGYHLSDLRNLSSLGEFKEKLVLPNNSEHAANLLLTFSHLASFLLDRQITSAKDKFIKVGGLTEELFRKRSEYRYNKGKSP